MKHLNLFLLILILSACQGTTETEPEEVSDLSGSLAIEGTTLKYAARGQGAPFLVVGSSADYFSEGLEEHFRLYFIDIRGTAEEYSPIDTGSYNMETLISDIDTLRAVLGLEKFIIGGHSVLGAVSLEYARRHPERISQVVMIGTPRIYGSQAYLTATEEYWAAAPETRKQLFAEKQKQLAATAMDSLSPAEVFVKNVVAQSPKRWHDPNFDATPFLGKVHFNMDFVGHLFGRLFPAFDLCQAEKPLNVPVLVITGKSDYICPPTLWEGECASLPKLRVSLFEESGHTPHYEQSSLFEEQLLAWVRDQ